MKLAALFAIALLSSSISIAGVTQVSKPGLNAMVVQIDGADANLLFSALAASSKSPVNGIAFTKLVCVDTFRLMCLANKIDGSDENFSEAQARAIKPMLDAAFSVLRHEKKNRLTGDDDISCNQIQCTAQLCQLQIGPTGHAL